MPLVSAQSSKGIYAGAAGVEVSEDGVDSESESVERTTPIMTSSRRESFPVGDRSANVARLIYSRVRRKESRMRCSHHIVEPRGGSSDGWSLG